MKLQLSLWDNSQSFFRESVSKALLAESDPIAWKFAILALVQAIELVIKERLRREHPLLILENVDKPSRTVSLDQGVARLKGLGTVRIEATDISALERAKHWRNAIVHSDVDVDTDQLKAAFSTLLGFYSAFSKRHLNLEVYSVLPEVLLNEALAVSAYSAELIARAESEMAEEGVDSEWIWECRSCGLSAFVVQDDCNCCRVCGWHEQTVHCEHCRSGPFYLEESEEFDFGNHKGIEILRRLCHSCAAKVRQSYDDEAWFDLERR